MTSHVQIAGQPGTPSVRAVGDGARDHASSLSTSRGTTQIKPHVIEKIAAQAVREVKHATGSARHVLGINVGGETNESTDARVSAIVDGPVATVSVSMTVIYPASVRDVTRRTRSQVIDRVRQLTDVHVRQVDITVDGMRARALPTPRVR